MPKLNEDAKARLRAVMEEMETTGGGNDGEGITTGNLYSWNQAIENLWMTINALVDIGMGGQPVTAKTVLTGMKKLGLETPEHGEIGYLMKTHFDCAAVRPSRRMKTHYVLPEEKIGLDFLVRRWGRGGLPLRLAENGNGNGHGNGHGPAVAKPPTGLPGKSGK